MFHLYWLRELDKYLRGDDSAVKYAWLIQF